MTINNRFVCQPFLQKLPYDMLIHFCSKHYIYKGIISISEILQPPCTYSSYTTFTGDTTPLGHSAFAYITISCFNNKAGCSHATKRGETVISVQSDGLL